MKKNLLILGFLSLFAAVFVALFNKEGKEVLDMTESPPLVQEDKSAIERFILEHLMTSDNMIRTNFAGKKSGDLFLSESLGLWMEYLSIKGDKEQFAQAFKVLKQFFQMENGLISWQIDNGEKASTNALIDDLRIIEALFRMGEKENHKEYIEEAIHISKALIKHQTMNDYLVDFYDEEYDVHNDFLTLSYINMEAIYYMEKYKLINKKIVENMESLLKELPMKDVFYAQTFNLSSHTFSFEEEINLIDQLYIALHLERAGIDTEKFNRWLQDKFYENSRLYGRYDAVSKTASVEYESVAVYALGIMYCLERGDEKCSEIVENRMLSLQEPNKKAQYFGGFTAKGIKNTHSFDNLLALLAERKLLDAQDTEP